MHCGNCRKRRKSHHIGDDYRSNFCQACRKAGHNSVRYCKFCGWSVGEDHDACAHHIRGSVTSSSSGSDDNDYASDSTDSSDESSGDEESDDSDSDEEDSDDRSPSLSPRPLSQSSSRNSIQQQRVKCNVCKSWFDDADELETHEDANDTFCRKHGMCFPQDDLYDHAREYCHKRCFVPDCKSAMAKYDHSDEDEVEDHVYHKHAKRS